MTNTITLTDEQLANLNAGKSITIDPPQQTPCQQRGLRVGQWVCVADGGIVCDDGEWVKLVEYDGSDCPFFSRGDEKIEIRKYLDRIDWSRGIHDEKPVEKWEPKNGVTVFVSATKESVTREHFDRAEKKLRQYARLLAWRDERCPDYVEPELGEEASYVFWRGGPEGWGVINTTDADLLSVPMPYSVAKQLAHDLNAGKVEL